MLPISLSVTPIWCDSFLRGSCLCFLFCFRWRDLTGHAWPFMHASFMLMPAFGPVTCECSCLHALPAHRNRECLQCPSLSLYQCVPWAGYTASGCSELHVSIVHEVWQVGRTDTAQHHTQFSLAPHCPSDKSPEQLLHASLACITLQISAGL